MCAHAVGVRPHPPIKKGEGIKNWSAKKRSVFTGLHSVGISMESIDREFGFLAHERILPHAGAQCDPTNLQPWPEPSIPNIRQGCTCVFLGVVTCGALRY